MQHLQKKGKFLLNYFKRIDKHRNKLLFSFVFIFRLHITL